MANEFKTIRCAKATYDFDVQGGEVADAIGLGISIPKGAVILSVIGSAETDLTSDGSATVAINVGTTEVLSAIAFDNVALKGVDEHFTTATKLTATSEINIDIAVADLTDGVYDIYVQYIY